MPSVSFPRRRRPHTTLHRHHHLPGLCDTSLTWVNRFVPTRTFIHSELQPTGPNLEVPDNQGRVPNSDGVSNFEQTGGPFRSMPRPMFKAEEFRSYAQQALAWAASARNPEHRQAFMDLARTWEQAARVYEMRGPGPVIRQA
jgi:hypothetical protein